MKYVVDVNGQRVEVVLDADGVMVDGERVHAHVADVVGTPVKVVTIGDEVHRAVARRVEKGTYSIQLDGRRYTVEALDERTRAIRDMTGAAAAASGPAPLKAPMPGLIVRVHVQPGDEVSAGQPLVVMEAMKMENELRAPTAGTVRTVAIQPGTAVEKGALLVDFS